MLESDEKLTVMVQHQLSLPSEIGRGTGWRSLKKSGRRIWGLTLLPQYFCFLLADNASLELSAKRKQKYQNGNIHRKLLITVQMSVMFPRPKIQYGTTVANDQRTNFQVQRTSRLIYLLNLVFRYQP